MDMTQPAREIVTHHADSHGGFYTTSLFWDCSCDEHYIHPFTQPDCPACGDCREDAAEARQRCAAQQLNIIIVLSDERLSRQGKIYATSRRPI